jgi:hypothetical protein
MRASSALSHTLCRRLYYRRRLGHARLLNLAPGLELLADRGLFVSYRFSSISLQPVLEIAEGLLCDGAAAASARTHR